MFKKYNFWQFKIQDLKYIFSNFVKSLLRLGCVYART